MLKVIAEFVQSVCAQCGSGFKMMAGVDAQLRMLLLLLQTLFALSQTAAPTTEVYICPGLSSNEAHSYSSKDQHQLQAESADGCMCSKTGTTVVSQGTRLLLLCVSEKKLGETKKCLWTLGQSPNTTINNRSDITGKKFDGKLGLWEDKRCSFNGNISADNIVQYACYHEMPSANHLANGFWKCSINDQNGLTTSSTLLPPRLEVKARCESNGNCNRDQGEVCDSRNHYCRPACEGTDGGTATCHRTISKHSICRANQSSNSGYSCRCSEGTVPIYSEQGNLTNCMRSCSSHTQCKEDEKCGVQSGAVCNQPQNTSCSDGQKICSHVCKDIRCGENQLCQPKTALSHEGECVCSSEEYVALPDGKRCVEPYLRYKKLNIGLYLQGRSRETPDKFELYNTSVPDAFGATTFTMYRRETVRIICSLKAGYPYPTVNWTLREPSQYPGVLHQVTDWNTDYQNMSKDTASPVPKYAKDAAAQIYIRNLTALPSGRSGSNDIHLTCRGKHVNLAKKNPGGFLETAIKLIVKDCTQDEDCLERERCNHHKCKDVCVILSADERNPCGGANQKCVSSRNHSFECHCKEGFARDNKQSACLKKCANPSNCNIRNGETCSKGLCREVCEAIPCGHGTKCKADNIGGRRCNCHNNSLFRYDDTSCFPAVKGDPKNLRVRVRNQDLICESKEPLFDCNMHQAEPGNSTWNITIFFDHVFPKPKVEGLLVNNARLQQSVLHESELPAKIDGTPWKAVLALNYTFTFTMHAAYAYHGKDLKADISHVSMPVIHLSIKLNVAGCTKDNNCLKDQVCTVWNEDNQNKCLDVCSEQEKAGPSCPAHSKCIPHAEKDHESDCKCIDTRALIMWEGERQCLIKCTSTQDCENEYKTCQRWNTGMTRAAQDVCLPTCTNVHCGPDAECKEIENHAYMCRCGKGFYADDGQNSVQGKNITCHRPVAPTPAVPHISMQLGHLKEVNLCSDGHTGSTAGGTACSEFFVAENADVYLKCHLEQLFPAPKSIVWEIVENMGETAQLLSLETKYTATPNMARPCKDCKIWKESDQHFNGDKPPYARSFFSEINIRHIDKHVFKGRRIRCSVPHESLQGAGKSIHQPAAKSMYSTTTAAPHVFGCSKLGCGRVEELSGPTRPVRVGSKVELKCKTDLPLLQRHATRNDEPDCKWTMKRTNLTEAKEVILLSFFSWNQTIKSVDGISRNRVNMQQYVTQYEQKTDCSLILNAANLDLEGHWTCSATLFNGTTVDSGKQQDGPAGEALVYILAPPTSVSVDLMYAESNELKETEFNVSRPDLGKNPGNLPTQRIRVDYNVKEVKLTFNCTAYRTHPAPEFEWTIHSDGKNMLIGEERNSKPGEEVIEEAQRRSSSSPTQSVADGESGTMSMISIDGASAPTLKTYVSTLNYTFEVLNDQWESILSKVDVKCKVVQSSRDERKDSLTKLEDTITIVFQEKPHVENITLIGSIAAGFSFLMLVFIIAATLVIIKRRRNKNETGQDFFTPVTIIDRWLQRRRGQPRPQPTSNNSGGSSAGTVVPAIPASSVAMSNLRALPSLPSTSCPARPAQQPALVSARANRPEKDGGSSSVRDDDGPRNRQPPLPKMPDLVKNHPLLPACTPLILDEVYSRPGQAFQPPEAFNPRINLPKTHNDHLRRSSFCQDGSERGQRQREENGQEGREKAEQFGN